MEFRTRAIHVGNSKEPLTGAVVRPIFMTSTFVQERAGEWGEYDYTRSGNPTRTALEQTLASLEGGNHALLYSTGMAAVHAAMMLVGAGDHIIVGTDIYGGTFRLLHKVLDRYQIEVTQVPLTDLDRVAAAFTPRTKMLWLESPGNPLLSIVDIAACAELGHQHGALVGIDNTLASPVLQRPLELGVDIVMHSATKSIGGHSDLMGGALITRDKDLHDSLYRITNATGPVMGPMEAFLCTRGLKTIELRVKEQSRSALAIAEFLEGQSWVQKVNYPGLASHPQHALASKQMVGGFGMVLSFEIKGDLEQTKTFVSSTKLFQLAVSLGAVESLIAQPATMSHAAYDRKKRHEHGISDGLIRLSVGLEDVGDLKRDLVSAREKSGLA